MYAYNHHLNLHIYIKHIKLFSLVHILYMPNFAIGIVAPKTHTSCFPYDIEKEQPCIVSRLTIGQTNALQRPIAALPRPHVFRQLE